MTSFSSYSFGARNKASQDGKEMTPEIENAIVEELQARAWEYKKEQAQAMAQHRNIVYV